MNLENRAGVPDKLLKPYNAAETESEIYKKWEESGYFNPDVCVEQGITDPNAEPFSMVLPPPNVTGRLHLGHALEHSLQDAVIRFQRMRGKKTVWIPGTDHAAIATQARFEKESGKKRHDFSREEFFDMVQEFGLQNQQDMRQQMRLFGSSLDWSREAFTLDEKRGVAVKTAFKKMYDDGLIYRDYRIVNWDPKGQTTISDDEIVYEERDAKLYTFKYWADFPITISTTRPETKVGDVAVAVHPDDARYQKFIGNTYTGEFCGVSLSIKVVADESVEPEFGTGALGVTPAHSQIDWDIAQRHNLEVKPVINEYAKMTVGNENILNKKTTEAREVIVEWLRTEGLLEKEESIKQNVSTAERSGGIVEPLPKLQWFVNVNKPIESRGGKTLKDLMLAPITNGEIAVMPDRYGKVYENWVTNLRDWCISRQIIYGHQIPVWYDSNGSIHLPKEQKIIFVRHGESEANLSRIYAGQLDSPLTTTGKEQAKAVAEQLKSSNVSCIICSDLSRAYETAEIISKEINVSNIIKFKDLREFYAGDLEGQAINDRGPGILLAHDLKTGESFEEIFERAKKMIEEIKKIETEGTILVVGHATFTCAMLAVLDGIQISDFYEHRKKWRLPNANTIERTLFINPTGKDLTQDTDTLDTWFSSALWTFSTLGWPEHTEDLKNFHPTTFMNPGYEIIFFWVARMVMMSNYLLDVNPFKTVYLHGIVRDAKGVKFSKSLKNGIEPEEIVRQFGTDALRIAMVVGIGPGNDLNFDEQKVKAYSKFANKIWNATRFVMEQTHNLDLNTAPEYDDEDQLSINELHAFVSEITQEMEEFKFYLVSEKLYHYFWHTFADVIIERSKKKITETNSISAQWVLYTHLTTLITVLHPFMPFITEEIWSMVPGTNDKKLLIIQSWPELQ